ncbi:hypothetical protein DFH09DRAFT_1359193 [Mycena vulgaris]|nr:hypothetical protein DFH09DRAFT_1359193 [Mycena vulgaris]
MFNTLISSAFLFVILAHGVAPSPLGPEPVKLQQCGPGPYDRQCPPADVCCGSSFGNFCKPIASDLLCPAPAAL